ncbi:MAG: M3 family oligoendopeptidase [Flavobacteriales bacterium]
MELTQNQTAAKKPRFFVPQRLMITSWADVRKLFETLDQEDIDNKEQLLAWLKKLSELEAVMQEELAWRYIRHTCNTKDQSLSDALHFYYQEIEPHTQKFFDKFNRKILASAVLNELEQEQKFQIYFRSLRKSTEIFREENLQLISEIQTLSSEYGKISGAMTIFYNDKEYTFNQAANFLKERDRNLRKEILDKIMHRRFQDKDKLNKLFDDLLQKRHKMALNAGFKNFRDYMFAELGRFDYSPEDCKQFHQSIIKHVVPAVQAIEEDRKRRLGYDILKPYDLDVDPDGNPPLKVFENGEQLLALTIKNFKAIDPEFAEVIARMNQLGHLDLESRIGKAPGGYNYPLYESGLPFIFMNAAGDLRDVVTMAHEGGHAVHAVLCDKLELSAFKHTPSEIAEVASMAMELIAMEHWDTIFSDQDELKRAKHIQLEKILSVFPWIACVDAFQHWVYENPDHTIAEREKAWTTITNQTQGIAVDRSDYALYQGSGWHKQLHIFEVPFYYIEYAIAQLGAIGIWKNYKENPQRALRQYKDALTAGYTKTLPELYRIAGVEFNFSSEYVKSLTDFVLVEKAKI